MEENTLTDQFVNYLWDFNQREISEECRKEIQFCLVDYLGAYLAGAKIGKKNVSSLLQIISGDGNHKALGVNQPLSLENVALLQGIVSHYAELDDGQRIGLLHPGTVIFSALLAWHQKFPMNQEVFYKAALLGYESSIRLAECVQPSAKIKGFHGTGLFGTIGAALACATAIQANKQQLKNTLAAACTSASGILRVIKNTSQLKPFNSGNAAKNAVSAALMAKAGFEGPIDTLDNQLGFLNMYDENFKREKLLEKTEKPKLFSIYRKPYAACRHCHPAIDLALEFRNNHHVQLSDIKKVKIKTYTLGISGHEHIQIVGVNSAKMSTPYSFAVALFSGKAGLAEFEENYFTQPEIVALTNKVTVHAEEYFDTHYPHKRGAEITVECNDGNQFTLSVDLPKGEPETKMSELEIETKFKQLAIFSGITKQSTDAIFTECSSDKFTIDVLMMHFSKLNLINF